jgi:1,2-phenylacetyl-CoA epoxidase catalytic subunit
MSKIAQENLLYVRRPRSFKDCRAREKELNLTTTNITLISWEKVLIKEFVIDIAGIL